MDSMFLMIGGRVRVNHGVVCYVGQNIVEPLGEFLRYSAPPAKEEREGQNDLKTKTSNNFAASTTQPNTMRRTIERQK